MKTNQYIRGENTASFLADLIADKGKFEQYIKERTSPDMSSDEFENGLHDRAQEIIKEWDK